jgi:hypothetical protein
MRCLIKSAYIVILLFVDLWLSLFEEDDVYNIVSMRRQSVKKIF